MNEKKEVKSPDAEAPQALADETLEGISGGSAEAFLIPSPGDDRRRGI